MKKFQFFCENTLTFLERPSSNSLKSCRTVLKMASNAPKQRPSIIKSVIFLPDASSPKQPSRLPEEVFEKEVLGVDVVGYCKVLTMGAVSPGRGDSD